MAGCKLSEAICTKDIERVRELLESGRSSADGDGSEKYPPVIECVISEPVDGGGTSDPDEEDDTFNVDEEDAKRSEILALLAKHGADVNASRGFLHPNTGSTAVMCAASRGYWRCLRVLADSGADLQVRNHQGDTPLALATRYGNTAAVRVLLDRGVDVRVGDKRGETALFLALEAENRDTVKLLLERGSDVVTERNRLGETVLMTAVRWGDAEILALLLRCGSGLDERDRHGRTALMHAAAAGNVAALAFLLERGVDMKARDKNGHTVIMNAAEFEDLAGLTLLLEKGADMKVKDKRGRTVLTRASQFGNGDAVSLLLEWGACVNTVTADGGTPLTAAIEAEELDIAVKLLQNGADPTLSRRLRDGLHRMVGHKQNALVQALVMNGFPPLDLSGARVGISLIEHIPTRVWRKIEAYLATTEVSPLAVALLYNRPETSRYLISNRFFTRYDIVRLCWDSEVRRILQDVESMECLEILNFLSESPQSLLNLSLVVVSSALSQNFALKFETPSSCSDTSDSSDSSDEEKTDGGGGDTQNGTQTVIYPWEVRPTFRDRVHRSGLPEPLQRFLLHQTPSSDISPQTWHEVRLRDRHRQGTDQDFS